MIVTKDIARLSVRLLFLLVVINAGITQTIANEESRTGISSANKATTSKRVANASNRPAAAAFAQAEQLQAGDVIIAGFQASNSPDGQAPGEFVALFNTTNLTISLENMNLISRVDDTNDGNVNIDWQLSGEAPDLAGKSIAPHSFFLIAESGVAAPGDVHDLGVRLNLATSEGGGSERAISLELVIDGVHMDYVLYGRHDGADLLLDVPPGDLEFDGVSYPRNEVIRNTRGASRFNEGLIRRVTAEGLYAGHAVDGFYTDEDALGDGLPEGIWNSPHDQNFGDYQARNSLSPAVPPPSDDGAPPVISNVAASSVSSDAATISWETDEPADSQVEYGLDANYGHATALDLNLVVNHSQGLNNLTPNTLYHYRVLSKDAATNQAASDDFTFSTPALPLPNPPSDLNATATGASTIDLTWTDNASNEDGVKIERKLGDGGFAEIATVGENAAGYTDSDLQPNTTYSYRVRAFNATGPSDYSNEASATTADQPAQFTLTVSTEGSGGVALDPAGGVYDDGAEVTLTATPAAGWVFSGWSGDLTGNDNPATVTMEGDMTVTAIFTELADAEIIFSAMADVPYSHNEELLLQEHIQAHNQVSPSEFMVHLGDIKHGSTSCNESKYSDVAGFLLELNVPTFIIIGDNEWNDCSDPDQALAYWETHFTNFEQNFANPPAVERQSTRQDNFAFTIKGVLFAGVRLPDGTISDSDEWDAILQDNADWIEQQFQGKGDQVRAAVIFAHTGPGDYEHELFFDQFEESVSNFGKPVLFMHGNGHVWILDHPFSAENVLRVQLRAGGGEEPLQITATLDAQNPFEFLRNPLTNPNNISTFPTNVLTVKTDGSGKVKVLPAGGVYHTGSVVELQAQAAPGYQFIYWSDDLRGSNNPESMTMNSSKTVTATFRVHGPSGVVMHEETRTGASNGGVTVETAELTAVGGDLYIAAVNSTPKRNVASVSGLGLTWTRLAKQCSGRNRTGVELWWAQGSPVGNSPVIANFSKAPANAVLAVSRYSGVDQKNPLGNIVSGNTNGLNGVCNDGMDNGDYSFLIEATSPGSIVYGAAATEKESHTQGIGYTERADLSKGYGSSAAGITVQDQIVSGAATIALDGTFSSSIDWAVVGVEIKPQPGRARHAYQELDSVEVDEIPVMHSLGQNYPNPFNPTTIIKFSLPEYAKVSIKVYNLHGREVARLVDGFFPAGTHKITFRPQDLPSGVYMYELRAGEVRQVRRLIYVK